MEIIRGDYTRKKFQRQTKSNEVITEKPDKVYFTVKTSEYKKSVLFQKTFENGITFDEETGWYTIEILPEDTNDLNFDTYIYDIEIIKDSKPKTIKIDKFIVTKEVTFAENEV